MHTECAVDDNRHLECLVLDRRDELKPVETPVPSPWPFDPNPHDAPDPCWHPFHFQRHEIQTRKKKESGCVTMVHCRVRGS
jgi:hypothetical protein